MSSNAKVQYGPRSITFYDVSGFTPVQGAGSMILGQGDARQLDIGRYTTNSTDSNLFIRIDTSFNRMIVGNNFTDL
jgi:UDP-3-O-[3-hydroxymyristoyl] glucosamine N-acyltransferase